MRPPGLRPINTFLVRAEPLRKRIAGMGTAVVLAITLGVMGATGIALAGGHTTTATTPADAQIVTIPSKSKSGDCGGSGRTRICRIPMLVSIAE
jgi:hypothetical protein